LRNDHDGRGRSVNRRELLRIGGLGAFGLSLPDLLRAEDRRRAAGGVAPIRSCILVFYYGGPSHLDTWDMKPKAPKEVRGEFGSIATNVPGRRVSEHLPCCARIMDRLAVIRSVHHPMTNHNAAAFATLAGRNPSRGDQELLGNERNDPPCLGSTLSDRLPRRGALPAFVSLPHVMRNVVMLPGQIAGFLGSAHDPLQISGDPSSPAFRNGDLELPGDISLDRLESRAALLRAVDDQARRADRRSAAQAMDVYNEKALRLLGSGDLKRALNLGDEDPRLRDRYGRTKHGQSMLLARRLVEAGVRFVSVYDHEANGQLANWDSHADVFPRHKDDLLPPADRALAALVEDLAARGMLDETLVIAMGEFGRTPKINNTAGRDHWPYCYSVVLAGGGVAGGVTYGSSDKLGAYPETDAVTPGDLAATLLWRFGLDPADEIIDLTGRPYRLAEGQPIRGLFPGSVG
jgi:hypothetical protein